MKIVLLALFGVLVAGAVAYIAFFPPDQFISFSRPDGGRVTFSRTGISFDAAPDHYAANGSEHIEPYIVRLLAPGKRFKFLHIFTPDGKRGFGLTVVDGAVEAGLSIDRQQEGQREVAIRDFFNSLGIAPSRDYLAGNGDVDDATRILDYPISGTPAEVTAITKQILQELCGISPTEALDISYGDK